LAYPAEHRDSDATTFMIDQQGIIVEKDLGPDTAKIAPPIASFNPDSTRSELQEGEWVESTERAARGHSKLSLHAYNKSAG